MARAQLGQHLFEINMKIQTDLFDMRNMMFALSEYQIALLAILISLAAFIFSIISFVRSQRIKRIENYLQFGTSEGIDLQISKLEKNKQDEIQRLTREFEQKKQKLEHQLADINAFNSSTRIVETKKLENELNESIESIRTNIDNEIKLLQIRKENVAKL